jgi:hypothetical protein
MYTRSSVQSQLSSLLRGRLLGVGRDLMLLVNEGFTTIPTCLLFKGKGSNDEISQPSKIPIIDKQHWACQRGLSLQRRQQVLFTMVTPAVVMRVRQFAKAMNSDLMAMTTMMRVVMAIVMVMMMMMSLNLKANASHVCLH